MGYQVNNWANFGDISPWHGQLWIKNAYPDSQEDFAECVETIGPSDFSDLADNQLLIRVGSIYIPLDDNRKVESALDTIGKTPSLASWIDLALAFNAWHGIEQDYSLVVQVGKELDTTCKDTWADTMESDIVLHGNAKIKNYIAKNYLT